MSAKPDRAPPGRIRRFVTQSGLGYVLYRHRYLALFTVFGFASILIELLVVSQIRQFTGGFRGDSVVGFLTGMIFSFVCNSMLNFRVPRHLMWRSFTIFAAISTGSFTLNLALMWMFWGSPGENFAWLRLATAGVLFAIGYSLHRKYTFSQARNFGLAVYACESEDVELLHELVGDNCDHIHIDLIDETMAPNGSPVCLENIDQAKKLWRRQPVSLHVMSLHPERWMSQTWDSIDWFLLHLESKDNLWQLILACRQREKKVGIVWRPGIPQHELMPYLPHIDFVMVLGILQAGVSGQSICPEAVEFARALDQMRSRYNYAVMFDGGVKETNVDQISAKYIIAASAVVRAENPVVAAHVLRSGAVFRRAA